MSRGNLLETFISHVCRGETVAVYIFISISSDGARSSNFVKSPFVQDKSAACTSQRSYLHSCVLWDERSIVDAKSLAGGEAEDRSMGKNATPQCSLGEFFYL